VPDWDDAAVAERPDVAARHPLAATVLDAAAGQIVGRGDALATPVATHYAEQTAARVEAQLGTPRAA
jgi:hypothetical protein